MCEWSALCSGVKELASLLACCSEILFEARVFHVHPRVYRLYEERACDSHSNCATGKILNVTKNSDNLWAGLNKDSLVRRLVAVHDHGVGGERI